MQVSVSNSVGVTYRQELELYKDALMNKPAVLALNKMDIEGADEILEDIMEKVNNLEGKLISSSLGPVRLAHHAFSSTLSMYFLSVSWFSA